ncbi:ribosomal RNA-processing protein 7-domain-containing protein [Flammula alnicola]|nr:ribosomal RNA-processing protein 7-domain-containing protein [Flammula alnicola]
MAIPSNISGFSVIPILYNSSTTHYLYARSHTSKSDSHKVLPEGRTLFLVNLPPDATERELVMFFKHSGTVEKVIFDFDVKEPQHDDSDSEEEEESMEEEAADEQPRKRRKTQKDKSAVPLIIPLPSRPLRNFRKTGSSAYVIFLDSSSLDRALASTSKPRAWPTSPEELYGLAHYRALYDSLRPPLDAVRAFADSSVEVHEYELAKSKQKSKYRKGEAIVDEDGFTLVTRGGAYGKTLGGGVAVASKRFQRSGETARNRSHKKEKKEKAGFYAFQKAEKQRSDLMELKRKWEEDKAKVEKLKAARRFKPY